MSFTSSTTMYYMKYGHRIYQCTSFSINFPVVYENFELYLKRKFSDFNTTSDTHCGYLYTKITVTGAQTD